MRKFRTLLGAGVAGACALAVLPGVALAAPTAPYTALTVDLGEHRAFPVTGSAAYDKSSASVSVANQADGLFLIKAVNPTDPTQIYAALAAEPPTGQDWAPGQTYPTSRVADAGHARLDLTSTDRSCPESSGSISVQDVQRDPTTRLVTTFAAAYRFTCAGETGPITGEVRYNSPLDYVAAVSDPSSVDFGSVHLGDPASKPVYVRSLGSASVNVGAASLGGTNPEAFAITADYCSGRTIQSGSKCLIMVKPRLTQAGQKSAVLYLPDNSPAGRRVVPLKVNAVDGVKGTYYPVAPARLMDTRTGLGGRTVKLGPDSSVSLQVAGRGGVPATGVGAVVLNVTVTGPTADSFLTVYPGGSRPTGSSINFAKDWLGSNNVTAMLDAGGNVYIYNRNGYTHVVVDVVGFYAGTSSEPAGLGRGGQYQSYEPYRLFDSRQDYRGALPAGFALNDWVDFGDYNKHVRALVLNITAVNPQKDGFLTAWDGAGIAPNVSTVNYRAGKVVPNLAFVQTQPCPVGGCGVTGAPRFNILTSATTHLVVDLVGVIDDGTVADGLRFRPNGPVRITDSRIGQGLVKALAPGETGRVDVTDTAPGMLDDTTEVLAMNVTAVAPEKNTVLTVWPADAGMAKPTASNLNPAAGQIVSNGVLGVLGPQDAFNVHNLTGYTNVVADVVGRFYRYPATASTPALSAGASRPQIAGTGVSGYERG
ncbi:choice-of-anchor D domain-containing protein [Micromonospora sp. DPT]|uniref:choice-of-anchor D domain-containing protein n=1 Tax=Micromonospora sp. DPT TaxID=3142975 RepID=UPI00320B2FB7